MRALLLGILVSLSPAASAAMQAQPLEWEHEGATYAGYLVYADAGAKRPGLVMVPNWMGVSDDALATAKDIAGDDYVVLVADMFGKGVHPKDHTEAREQVMKAYKSPGGPLARVARAVEVLKAQAERAPLLADKIGAFGFCFGGSSVIDLARSGADIDGVVSLHGGLQSDVEAKAGTVKASILVLNGAQDTSVPDEHIAAFEQQMDAAGADWQFVDFSGAKHCFTTKGENSGNCVYDERTAKRAFQMMHNFFAERFAN